MLFCSPPLEQGVPYPFLSSPGRVLTKEGKNKEIKELNEKDAKKIIRKKLFDELKKDVELPNMAETPYKEFKETLQKKPEASSGIAPAAKDALLLKCADTEADKLYEHQTGNKVVFSLASQFVTSNATDPEQRVTAALCILTGFDEAEFPPQPDEKPGAPKHPRFLFRASGEKEGEAVVWQPLTGAEAAEFALGFVFEVVLEKEIDLVASKTAEATATAATQGADAPTPPSKDPVPDPTDNDVLFGRGGMTNSHPGNRRFRDIIALHRPGKSQIAEIGFLSGAMMLCLSSLTHNFYPTYELLHPIRLHQGHQDGQASCRPKDCKGDPIWKTSRPVSLFVRMVRSRPSSLFELGNNTSQ